MGQNFRISTDVTDSVATLFLQTGKIGQTRWRTIVEDGKRISDQVFEAVIRAFGQLEEGARVVKVMNRWLN
jgi:hypothetical protein